MQQRLIIPQVRRMEKMLKMGNVNINGTSQIAGKDAVYFNASFSDGSGNYIISKNITDVEAYNANEDECNADYAEFEQAAKRVSAEIRTIQAAESEE